MAYFSATGTGGGKKVSPNYVVPYIGYHINASGNTQWSFTIPFDSGYMVSHHGGTGTHYIRINGSDATDDPSINKIGEGTETQMIISKIKKGDVITSYLAAGSGYSGCVSWIAILKFDKTITDFYSRANQRQNNGAWNIGNNTCPIDGMGIKWGRNSVGAINNVTWSGVMNNNGEPYDDFIQTTLVADEYFSIKELHENDVITGNVNGGSYTTNGIGFCCIKYH